MNQRDYMRTLFQMHGNNENLLVSGYAAAERRGIVHRKSNQFKLTPEQYARALYRDGIRKSWINQPPSKK